MRGLIVLVVSAICAGCSPDDKLISVCESLIKSGLKAPATYKRIAATTSVRDLDKTDTAVWIDGSDEIPAMKSALKEKAATSPLRRWLVSIESEASNSFGVPIRSVDSCGYTGFDLDGAGIASVRINGR